MDKYLLILPRNNRKRKVHELENQQKVGDNTIVPHKNVITTVKPVQMYLDYGQKSFGRTIQCNKCGLFYVISDKEDEKQHNKFCKQEMLSSVMR